METNAIYYNTFTWSKMVATKTLQIQKEILGILKNNFIILLKQKNATFT